MSRDRLRDIIGADAAAFWSLPEGDRIAMVSAAGAVPAACGPEVRVAPARGPVEVAAGYALYPDGDGGYVAKVSGFCGRDLVRRADAFSVMAAASARRGVASPFTVAQVAMGRRYADLWQRHSCAGIRCSSIEAQGGGGSGDGGFMDAVLADGQELDRLRRRIGDGIAKDVRRQRPSVTGSRRVITDRVLVDSVCLMDATISDVMDRHGWARRGRLRELLQEALKNALDRMCGPQGASGVVSTFEGPLKKVLDC